ncbi:MAG: 50S ribosomal protein L21 [Bacteroidetes bacterium]|nr:50S ribosomal protein L21 [Bacteroidota bacterium]HET6244175.1 50S ribosomal protein L21 [Bacteroidia bacterium]
MYAIVDIAGQQFKVEKDNKIYVNRLPGDEGSKVEFDNVLLVENDGKVIVGVPAVKGGKVTATIVSHLKGDKVIVFKKKRRKGYQKSNGHRQYLSQIQIEGIAATGI